MTDDQIQAAADLLWQHWIEGRRLPALPGGMRPATRADGYAVQGRLDARTRLPLAGWKIAATSAAGQQHIAVSGPLAGRLLRERVRESGSAVPLAGHAEMQVAEAEFAFRMGADLPPRSAPYTVAEALDAVATLHPAIEMPDSRYDDFTAVGEAQLIADNACAHYFVLGPAAPGWWRTLDLVEHEVLGIVNGAPPRTGKGANVLGDPREALSWLVNELSSLGITLEAGQVVTTGTCLAPLAIRPGDRVVADFGPLGTVEARIAAAAGPAPTVPRQ